MHSECRSAYCFLRVRPPNEYANDAPTGGWVRIISGGADTQSAAPADKGEQQRRQNSSAGSALAN